METKKVWRREGAEFFQRRGRKGAAAMETGLIATEVALRRMAAATRRAEAVFARGDNRVWVMQRRERTRRLIELGGLV